MSARWSIFLCLLLILIGCKSEAPTTGGRLDEPVDPDREGAALTFGTVTLKGLMTSGPGYQDAPATVRIKDTQSGYIVLGKLTPTAIPAATHMVIARMQGVSNSYSGTYFQTSGVAQYWPVYLEQADTIDLLLYNSLSRLYPEACKWTWDLRTRQIEDPHEPDDDDNVVTYTDRKLGRTVQSDWTTSWSLFNRDTAHRDLEEWFRLDSGPALSIKIDLATSDGTWGDWTYALRAVDQSGQVVGQWLNLRGGTQSFMLPSTGTGAQRYYFQLTGTPLRKDRGNIDWLSGTIRVSAITGPTWVSHRVAPVETSILSAAVINSKPLIIYKDSSNFGSNYFRVAKAKVSAPVSSADWDLYGLGVGNVYPPIISIHVHDNRVAIAYRDNGATNGIGPLNLVRQTANDPDGPEDWSLSTIRDSGDGDSLTAFSTGYAILHSAENPPGHFFHEVLVSSSLSPAGPADWMQVVELPSDAWLPDPYDFESRALEVLNDRVTVLYLDRVGAASNLILMRADSTNPAGTYTSHAALVEVSPWYFTTWGLFEAGGRIGVLDIFTLLDGVECERGEGPHETRIPRLSVSRVAEPHSINDWQTVMSFQSETDCQNFLEPPRMTVVDGRPFLIEDQYSFDNMHRAPSTDPTVTPYDARPLPAGVGYLSKPFDLNGYVGIAYAAQDGVYLVVETAGW